MTPPGSANSAANISGIIALLSAQALLVGSDTFIKLASASIPATQIMAMRGPITIAVMLAIVAMSGAWRHIPRTLDRRVLLRAGLEAVIALMFISALAGLALGDITAIIQATPLILTAMSIFVLGQRASPLELAVVAAGFLGVLLIVQPGANASLGPAILALLTAVMIAFRDIVTRTLDHAIPSSVVALATTCMVCVLGWAGAPFQTWNAMTPIVWAYIVATAFLVAIANLLMVRAFRGVNLAVVSPFRYAVVIWAMLVGYVVWGDRPNVLAAAGVVLIAGSGLILMRREWRKARQSGPGLEVTP